MREAAHRGGPEIGGGRFVLQAVMVFLVPLASATLGAFLAGRWWGGSTASMGFWQAVGAIVGFGVGASAARLAVGLLVGPRCSAEDGRR